QFELVQDFEQAPVPNPVAVVAPGEIARRLLAAAHRIHPQAGPEREMLDVERDIEGEPLASRPTVVFQLDDRRIGVSGMAREFQHGGAPCWLGRLATCRYFGKRTPEPPITEFNETRSRARESSLKL